MSYYDPPAGPQMPNKYPTAVGNNYRKYGEQQGKIYDPYTDKYYNPNPNSPERKKYFQDMGQIEKDPKEAGLMDQVLPAAVTMGSIYAAKSLGEQAPGYLSGLLSGSGSTAATTATTNLAAPVIVDAGRVAAGQSAQLAANTAGQEVVKNTPGMLGEAGQYVGPALAAAGAAKGAYDSYKGWQNGGEGLRSGLTTAGAGIGSLVAPGLGTAAGAAIGNTLGYGLQGGSWKNDAALLAATTAIGMPYLGAGLIGARRLGVDLVHKTTKQVQQEHTQDLSKLDPNNAAWQNYLGGMRNQVANKEAPFAGKYKTFDEYKKAGLQANDLTGVYGNLKTFGPEWEKLSFADKQKVTQALIDANMYNSKKGEVVVTDSEKAKQIRDQVLGIKPPPKVATKVTPKPLIDTKVTNKALGGLLAKK